MDIVMSLMGFTEGMALVGDIMMSLMGFTEGMALVGDIVMSLMEFTEGMALVRGIWKEECYYSFVWRRNYVSQIHGIRQRKRGR